MYLSLSVSDDTMRVVSSPGAEWRLNCPVQRAFSRRAAAQESLMPRTLMAVLATLTLTACGLAGTAATGAGTANAELEAARQAQQSEQRIRQQLEAAQQSAAHTRQAGEDAAN